MSAIATRPISPGIRNLVRTRGGKGPATKDTSSPEERFTLSEEAILSQVARARRAKREFRGELRS